MKYYNSILKEYVSDPLQAKGLVAIDEEAILASSPIVNDFDDMDADDKFDQCLFETLYLLPTSVIFAIMESLRISCEPFLDLRGKRFFLSHMISNINDSETRYSIKQSADTYI